MESLEKDKRAVTEPSALEEMDFLIEGLEKGIKELEVMLAPILTNYPVEEVQVGGLTILGPSALRGRNARIRSLMDEVSVLRSRVDL